MAVFEAYDEHDAIGLADLVKRGEVSAADLLETAIERVEQRNPIINAMSQNLFDHGREAIRNGLPEGPFRGVPFLLKDAAGDLAGYPTTNGARLLKHDVAKADSTIIERYKAAGLVIFGKTTTPEFSLAASTETSLTGATRNPWDRGRVAGGSSGGAAAVVAAGIVPAAHGSDGGGSIRIPASCCGLFGMKPTRARNPSGPKIGEGWGSLSVAHVLTRSVRDSAAMLDVTQGMAPGDPYCAPARNRPFLDEVTTPPGKLRIGYQTLPVSGAYVAEPCRQAAEEAVKLLTSLGHEVEQVSLPGDWQVLQQSLWVLVATNIARSIGVLADKRGSPILPSEVDRVTWNAIESAYKMTAYEYAVALHSIHHQSRLMAAVHEMFDIILSPTVATLPPKLGVHHTDTDDIGVYGAALAAFSPFTQMFNITGAPSMSVPLHWTEEGLPVGVMMSAPFGREGMLFRLAGQLEAERPWFHRRPDLQG